ncbi:MAG: DNA-binding protein with protein [Pseudomonas sp.]|jgi:LuxR family quorum-sensing transcriptional regulator LasR|nr:DNA-binding protein with protein [Pseudomonas sp.]
MKHVKLPVVDAPNHARLLHKEVEDEPVRLTAKESEVLIWAAKGKSVWEIARIQGRSEAAINFHMCNIRRKFGVSTIRAAVVMAITRGLISIS